MRRLRFHLLVSLLYLIPALFKVANALRRGISLTAPLGSMENLLLTDFVGKSSDTFLYYLPPAYAILKYGEPIRVVGDNVLHLCYRVVQSYVFIPFMAAFGEYFPLYYILFFSLLFANLLALLLWELNPGKYRLNLTIALLVLPVVFYYLPFLMLEAPTSSFLLAYAYFLIRYIRKGNTLDMLLSLPFLSLAAFLRPEVSLIGIPVILMVLRRKVLLAPSLLAVALPLGVNLYHARRCGDQSNFYLWAYALHVERQRGEPYTDVADLLKDVGDKLTPCLEFSGVGDPSTMGFSDDKLNLYFQLFQVNNREYSSCFRELLFVEINGGDLLVMLKRVPLNVLSLLIPSFSSSTFFRRLGVLKWPFVILIGLYGILLLPAIMCTWACGRVEYRYVVLSYFLLLLLYALYNPFGNFDALRFKLYLVPLEVVFIGFTLRAFTDPHSTV